MNLSAEKSNVTLHPAVAPLLVNDSKVVTAPKRNAAHC